MYLGTVFKAPKHVFRDSVQSPTPPWSIISFFWTLNFVHVVHGPLGNSGVDNVACLPFGLALYYRYYMPGFADVLSFFIIWVECCHLWINWEKHEKYHNFKCYNVTSLKFMYCQFTLFSKRNATFSADSPRDPGSLTLTLDNSDFVKKNFCLWQNVMKQDWRHWIVFVQGGCIISRVGRPPILEPEKPVIWHVFS